jgi:hypothetical protein
VDVGFYLISSSVFSILRVFSDFSIYILTKIMSLNFPNLFANAYKFTIHLKHHYLPFLLVKCYVSLDYVILRFVFYYLS